MRFRLQRKRISVDRASSSMKLPKTYLSPQSPYVRDTVEAHLDGTLRATQINLSKKNLLRGCLHDTGATFAPRRVHSGSLSWLYICLHDTTTKSHAGASRPGVSSLQLSHRGENFTPVRNLATVSCKHETTTRFGVKSV